MTGGAAFVLAQQYVKETADALGAVKGAPCEIEKIEYSDGANTVTFSWEGADGTKHKSTMQIHDGIDGNIKSLTPEQISELLALL